MVPLRWRAHGRVLDGCADARAGGLGCGDEGPGSGGQVPRESCMGASPARTLDYAEHRSADQAADTPLLGLHHVCTCHARCTFDHHVPRRVRCVYSICSRRALVLVQESAETVATFQHYQLRPRPRRRRHPTIRRRQVQAAMRPPTVVMINEHGARALQMPGVEDQEPNPGILIERSGRTALRSHSPRGLESASERFGCFRPRIRYRSRP